MDGVSTKDVHRVRGVALRFSNDTEMDETGGGGVDDPETAAMKTATAAERRDDSTRSEEHPTKGGEARIKWKEQQKKTEWTAE